MQIRFKKSEYDHDFHMLVVTKLAYIPPNGWKGFSDNWEHIMIKWRPFLDNWYFGKYSNGQERNFYSRWFEEVK